MAQQSLKNLDSFSRGYIEDVRSNIDFDTTLRAITQDSPSNNGLSIRLQARPASVLDGSVPDEIENPLVGKVVSGKGIKGIPRVVEVSADGLTITVDQVQDFTIAEDSGNSIGLTFSDANSGIDQYELVGSAKSRSKEDIRIENLVPEELLNYATSDAYGANTTGGIRTFLESYYKFMNLEEFTYKDKEIRQYLELTNQINFFKED